MTLLGEIDECIAGLDFPCPVPCFNGEGAIYANFVGANQDLFDLDDPGRRTRGTRRPFTARTASRWWEAFVR